MIKIIIYKTPTGNSPYNEWLNSLETTMQAIVEKRIAHVRLGNLGVHHNIKGVAGLFELIFDIGPGYRIYYDKKA